MDLNLKLLHHLQSIKLRHWDVEVRMLAAKSISKLLQLDVSQCGRLFSDLLADSSSPQLHIRHGSVLALSECLKVLSTMEGGVMQQHLSAKLTTEVSLVVGGLDKNRLFRGRGSELLRQAAGDLIGSIASGNISVHKRTAWYYLDFLNFNLQQPHHHVRSAAAAALGQVLFAYFSTCTEGSDDFPKLLAASAGKYINVVNSSDNVAVTRGMALAIGSLPWNLVHSSEIPFQVTFARVNGLFII